MIIERAEIPIKPGMEQAFADLAPQARKILGAAKGCKSVTIGRGVERPDRFVLLLQWDAVESHREFLKTSEFDAFKQLVGPYFAGPSAMEHFEIV